MKEGESAQDYVAAITGLAKSMDPPLPSAAIVEYLFQNLPKNFHRLMVIHDPRDEQEFEHRLARMITLLPQMVPDPLVQQLTKAVDTLTIAASAVEKTEKCLTAEQDAGATANEHDDWLPGQDEPEWDQETYKTAYDPETQPDWDADAPAPGFFEQQDGCDGIGDDQYQNEENYYDENEYFY